MPNAGGAGDNLSPFWNVTASLEVSVMAGMALAIFAMTRKLHHGVDGTFARAPIQAIFALGTSVYITLIFLLAWFLPHGPTATELVKYGFGEDRINLLFAVVFLVGTMRLYEVLFFVPPKDS